MVQSKNFSPKSYYLCITNNEIGQNSKSKPKKFSFLYTFKVVGSYLNWSQLQRRMSAGEQSLGPVSLTACLIMTLYRWVPALGFLVSIVWVFLQESTSYQVLLLCKTPG